MKFTRLAAAFALPLLAVATPLDTRGGVKTITVTAPPSGSTSVSQCNTGPIQCCQSVQSSNSGIVSILLGLLGIVLEGANVPVGVTCSPITVIGSGTSGCTANPVCCENNNFNGVIAIGCVPINLSL